MKHQLTRLLALAAILLATAGILRAEESKRGFYEADLANGGKVIFFVQANHALSAYLFDATSHQASFGGGSVADNGAFTLTTSSGTTITGTVNFNTINASVLGQNVVANRVSSFGNSDDVGGRFSTIATSANGAAIEVKILVDAQNRVFLIIRQGNTILGGVGTINITSVTSGHEDGDDDEDHDGGTIITGTFSVNLLSGGVVTGNLTFRDGVLSGNLVLNGVTYTFRAPRQSLDNRLANVSTRGFVTTGQGQLIGGFIIRGGPKLVLIRAIGPELEARGVTPALADPVLQLFDGATLLRTNDNWQSAPNANEIAATHLAPTDARESAILMRLEAGAYTAVIRGVNDTSGIALIEVYEVNH